MNAHCSLAGQAPAAVLMAAALSVTRLKPRLPRFPAEGGVETLTRARVRRRPASDVGQRAEGELGESRRGLLNLPTRTPFVRSDAFAQKARPRGLPLSFPPRRPAPLVRACPAAARDHAAEPRMLLVG